MKEELPELVLAAIESRGLRFLATEHELTCHLGDFRVGEHVMTRSEALDYIAAYYVALPQAELEADYEFLSPQPA